MKKIAWSTLTLTCILVLLLAGCTKDKDSTIKYYNLSEREKIIAQFSSDWFGIYDFSFYDDVQGAALYLDQWQNGKVVHSDLIASGSTTYLKSCYISVKSLVDKNNQHIGQEGDLRPAFIDERYIKEPIKVKYPKDADSVQAGRVKFLGEDGPKQNRLRPNNSYILAIQSYQFDEADQSMLTCEGVMEDPSQIKKENYIVVLRLQAFATKEEAEV